MTQQKNESLPNKVHPVSAKKSPRKQFVNQHFQPSGSSDATLIDDEDSVEGPPKALKTVLKFRLHKSRKESRLFDKKIEVDNIQDFWKLEEYGGVKIWVNSKTGDVSVENPEEDDEHDDDLCSHTSVKKSGIFFVHRESVNSKVPKSTSKITKTPKKKSKKSFNLLKILGFSQKKEEYYSPDVKEWFDMLDSGRTSRKIERVVTSQKKHGQGKVRV